jgi:hypothetical protein
VVRARITQDRLPELVAPGEISRRIGRPTGLKDRCRSTDRPVSRPTSYLSEIAGVRVLLGSNVSSAPPAVPVIR